MAYRKGMHKVSQSTGATLWVDSLCSHHISSHGRDGVTDSHHRSRDIEDGHTIGPVTCKDMYGTIQQGFHRLD